MVTRVLTPLVFVLAMVPVSAQDSSKSEIEQLRAEMRAMQQTYEARIQRLEAKLISSPQGQPMTDLAQPNADVSLEAELARELGEDAAPAANFSRPQAKLLDISVRGLFAAGFSTAREEQLRLLHLGGHDPKNRGFTIQELEVGLAGAVDPYFTGEAYLSFNLDPDAGESFVEIEEAFLKTISMPFDLQLKAGHFLTDFGRNNSMHAHSWAFVDAPVVSTRMFGADGLRSPGAELSWLAPTPWFSKLSGAVQNAKGETLYSFLSNEEQGGFGGHTVRGERDIRSFDDLLFSGRWLNSFALNDEVTTNFGLSGAWGPNRTGNDTHTQIYGADLYAKWQPTETERGWPFLALTSEFMVRRYEAAAFVLEDEDDHEHEEEEDEGHEEGEDEHAHGFGFLSELITESRPHESLWDWGLYTQLEWGFTPDWVAAVRYDYGDYDRGAPLDPSRSLRNRLSYNATWFPSEFSKWRLQHNIDWANFEGVEDTEHSLWLQWEFSLGAHGAHKF